MNYTTPLEWKSEVWWRKRDVEERLFHLHIPPRVMANLEESEASVGLMGGPHIPSTFIHGPSGCGKSVRAAAMLIAYIRNAELSGRWVDADDYVSMIKESFDNEGVLPEMYSSPHLIKYLKKSFDVVVVDALGDEYQTDFAKHELGTLIRKRHEAMKATIVTSRFSLKDITNKYGERLGTVLADFEVKDM